MFQYDLQTNAISRSFYVFSNVYLKIVYNHRHGKFIEKYNIATKRRKKAKNLVVKIS